jgi:hypothetical protein
LEDLLTAFSLAAVDIQRIWNQQEAPLALREWECKVTLSVTASRSTGFAVQAHPVNLGFAIAHHRTQKNSSSVTITIEAKPYGTQQIHQ